MKRQIYTAGAAAIACSTIGLLAQTSGNAAQQPPAVARIIVIGCVEPTDQTAANASPSESKYKLTHAKSGKNDSSRTTGTSGGATDTATTYRLDNAQNATLAKDEGHQVEIVAIIEPDTAATAAATIQPKLKVETIRVIKTTCPE